MVTGNNNQLQLIAAEVANEIGHFWNIVVREDGLYQEGTGWVLLIYFIGVEHATTLLRRRLTAIEGPYLPVHIGRGCVGACVVANPSHVVLFVRESC